MGMVATRAHQMGRMKSAASPSIVNAPQNTFLSISSFILDPGQLSFPRSNVYKGAMKRSLLSIAQAVQARVLGDGAVEVSGIASIPLATPVDLVFVEDEKSLPAALGSRAAAVIAGEFARAEDSKQTGDGKPLLICKHPRLAFARAAKLLGSAPVRQPGNHAGAVVDASARLGRDVIVAERAVIGPQAEVGDHTWIGAGAVIGQGVHIGRDCEIYPNVTIYAGARLGDRVIVHAGAVLGADGFGYVRDPANGHYEKFPQVGRLEIGDDVEIGANSTIDRGALEITRIGRGAKIDNLVHIGHNCQIGEDVVIAAQTGLSGSIVIEKNVVLGGQVGIGEHARLEEGVMLGGQGGVLPNKVLRGKGVAFWGTPARPVREYLKQLAALARLAKK
jgi:UDP-3-O-[3-hydroxymyristoyl] glucosamine N-acyltransferase